MKHTLLTIGVWLASVAIGFMIILTVLTATQTWKQQYPSLDGPITVFALVGTLAGFVAGGLSYRWGVKKYLPDSN